MRALAIAAVAAVTLAGCGDTLSRLTGATGLTQADLLCVAAQVSALPADTPKREAAGLIAEACAIDVADVLFGADATTVVAEGTEVVVAP